MISKSKIKAVAEVFNVALRIVKLDVVNKGYGILNVVKHDGFGGAAEGYYCNVSEAVFLLPEGLTVEGEESNEGGHKGRTEALVDSRCNLDAYNAVNRAEAFSLCLCAEFDDVIVEIVAGVSCSLASSDFSLDKGDPPDENDKRDDNYHSHKNDHGAEALADKSCYTSRNT